MEVVILLIIHCVECTVNKTKNINLNVFNMILRRNESKTLLKAYHANPNANLIVELTSNASAKVQENMCAKKIMLHPRS